MYLIIKGHTLEPPIFSYVGFCLYLNGITTEYNVTWNAKYKSCEYNDEKQMMVTMDPETRANTGLSNDSFLTTQAAI